MARPRGARLPRIGKSKRTALATPPAALAAAAAFLFAIYRWARRGRATAIAGAVLYTPTDDTSLDSETGSVASRQSADIVMPVTELDRLWNPEHLERVARTYWSSLERFTLGLIHVHYTSNERAVVLINRHLPLLTFKAPEYEMNRCRGIVRWRIERGLLVSRKGRDGEGYLELDLERHDYPDWDKARLHVEVEVANYYPALGGLSRRIYVNTQSRIHVVACTFFLRRLVRRELAPSKVGQYAGPSGPDQAPDPVPARERGDVG